MRKISKKDFVEGLGAFVVVAAMIFFFVAVIVMIVDNGGNPCATPIGANDLRCVGFYSHGRGR